jgi:hypothetical protein
MPWREGTDGERVRYSQRLLPPWWAWVAVLGFVASVAVAYGYAFTVTAGALVGAAGALAAAVLLLGTAPLVRIDERVLRVGRARLPLTHVGRIVPLDQQLSIEARTTRLDPAAHLLLRTATTGTSVMVEVTDPDDPHPYWLFSAKHPQQVATALARAVEEEGEARRGAPTREAPQ